MALVVAAAVADGQIFDMAAAAFAQGLNVFECGVGWQNMFAAHPAGHQTMQLARHCFVNLVPSESEFAHGAKHTATETLKFLEKNMSKLACKPIKSRYAWRLKYMA
jgi:hypothetical protein